MKAPGGPGMPAMLHLELFGSVVWDAFGHPPYLVGTALTSKQWRDVDVRLIIDDDEFDVMFPDRPHPLDRTCGKWAALCMAFSALGNQMTGLPIDFQIQARSIANAKWGKEPRESLGMIGLRMKRE